MKRAASPASLLDRSTPWLRWWQELILNWVASWSTVAEVTVTSSTTAITGTCTKYLLPKEAIDG